MSILEQLFSDLDLWPGFHLVSYEIRRPQIQNLDKSTLLLRLEPLSGSMPVCSHCHQEAPLVHEYITRRIADCPMFDMFVQLEVRIRRVDCHHCGHRCNEYVQWLPPYQRYTERLRLHVEHRTEEETVAYAAKETNVGWRAVKQIDKERLQREVGEFHWDNSHRLAVDEFAIHRRHRYATVVYSLDTKAVLWIGTGRSRATLKQFFDLLTPEQKLQIQAVAMDQCTAFDLEVKEQCPHAAIVYDLFHVLANFGRKVLDRVRVDVANQYRKDPANRRLVKGARYLLYKRPDTMTDREHSKLADLAKLNTPLMKCYVMGDELRHLWELGSSDQAEALVRDWIYRAVHSRIEQLVSFAKNLSSYIDGIVSAARYHISTSPLEGVNNKIKVIKRRAYGFHDDAYFFLKVKAAFPGLHR